MFDPYSQLVKENLRMKRTLAPADAKTYKQISTTLKQQKLAALAYQQELRTIIHTAKTAEANRSTLEHALGCKGSEYCQQKSLSHLPKAKTSEHILLFLERLSRNFLIILLLAIAISFIILQMGGRLSVSQVLLNPMPITSRSIFLILCFLTIYYVVYILPAIEDWRGTKFTNIILVLSIAALFLVDKLFAANFTLFHINVVLMLAISIPFFLLTEFAFYKYFQQQIL